MSKFYTIDGCSELNLLKNLICSQYYNSTYIWWKTCYKKDDNGKNRIDAFPMNDRYDENPNSNYCDKFRLRDGLYEKKNESDKETQKVIDKAVIKSLLKL